MGKYLNFSKNNLLIAVRQIMQSHKVNKILCINKTLISSLLRIQTKLIFSWIIYNLRRKNKLLQLNKIINQLLRSILLFKIWLIMLQRYLKVINRIFLFLKINHNTLLNQNRIFLLIKGNHNLSLILPNQINSIWVLF